MSGNALVEVQSLVKTYGEGRTATPVLKGLDLSLAQGEFTALVGASGSGKSTLLAILGTLMKPTSGRHTMLGVDLAAAGDRELSEFRNRHIGFVFQFHHLLTDFTALQNVLFPAVIQAGGETAASRRRGRELLERVGLGDRMDFEISQLSGGQKQRVAVARALMNQPELVLADEPTGNLDRESADKVMDLLRQINRDEKTCFLISTHDPRIAFECRRQVRILEGKAV